MKRAFLLALCALLLSSSLLRADQPTTLTVDRYIALTIARLQLAKSSWETRRTPPTPQEEEQLYTRHETTREEYLGYAGAHAQVIATHLDGDPDSARSIENLSAAVRTAIESTGDR